MIVGGYCDVRGCVNPALLEVRFNDRRGRMCARADHGKRILAILTELKVHGSRIEPEGEKHDGR